MNEPPPIGPANIAYSRLLPLLEAEGFEVRRVEEGGPVVVTPKGCLPKPKPKSVTPLPDSAALHLQAMQVLQAIDRDQAAARLAGKPKPAQTIIGTESCDIPDPTGGPTLP